MRTSTPSTPQSRSSPRPFYAPPAKQPTPSAIVRECREWLQTVNASRRPFTPRSSSRHLNNSDSSISRPLTASSTLSSLDSETSKEENGLTKPVLRKKRTPKVVTAPSRAVAEKCPLPLPKKTIGLEGISLQNPDKKISGPSSHSKAEKSEVSTLIQELEKLASKSKSTPNDLVETAKETYEVLETLHRKLERKSFGIHTTEERKGLIKVLFQVAALKNPRICLKVVEILSPLGLQEMDVAKACKIIYHVAKNAKNDSYFLENPNCINTTTALLNLLKKDLGKSSPTAECLEGLLYLCGALKFLSASEVTGEMFCVSEILNSLSEIHEFLDLELCTNRNCLEEFRETICNVLPQITETFCVVSNLESAGKVSNLLVNSGAFMSVLKSLSRHTSEKTVKCRDSGNFRQVLFNWSRAVAHATDHKLICRLFDEKDYLQYCGNLLEMLLLYKNDYDFVARMVLALGNITAYCDAARSKFFPCAEKLEAFCNFCDKFASIIPKDGSGGLLCDILMHLIRVITNASVGTIAGSIAANSPTCVSLLLNLTKIATAEEIVDQELLLNCLTGLNNVTFHMGTEPSSIVVPILEETVKECLHLLEKLSASHATCLSVLRVMGNLTRSSVGRSAVAAWKSDRPCLVDRLLSYVEGDNDEIVYAALGVLVNLMLQPLFLDKFHLARGYTRIIKVLQIFTGVDWQIASLVVKLISNYLSFLPQSSSSIDSEALTALQSLLTSYIDTETPASFSGDSTAISTVDRNEDARSRMKEYFWQEEFVPVAKSLLHLLAKS